jgi:hypothetical protein
VRQQLRIGGHGAGRVGRVVGRRQTQILLSRTRAAEEARGQAAGTSGFALEPLCLQRRERDAAPAQQSWATPPPAAPSACCAGERSGAQHTPLLPCKAHSPAGAASCGKPPELCGPRGRWERALGVAWIRALRRRPERPRVPRGLRTRGHMLGG